MKNLEMFCISLEPNHYNKYNDDETRFNSEEYHKKQHDL